LISNLSYFFNEISMYLSVVGFPFCFGGSLISNLIIFFYFVFFLNEISCIIVLSIIQIDFKHHTFKKKGIV
jgi:hypothetical protein